ncbi:MAG: hypothetical protein WC878_01810 [Candidatus Paceibacterota bacterium]
MNSLENAGFNIPDTKKEEAQRDSLTTLVNSLLKDFPPAGCPDEELRKGESVLDAKMAEKSREELLGLAMDIRQRLEEPRSGFADEAAYTRFATVYGAACMELEKRDEKE